jgi:hypothetical protein
MKMLPHSFLLIVLALYLTNTNAKAQDKGQYLEVHKSEPVEANGLEFRAATQSQWWAKASGSLRPIEIQLWITNRSGHDLAFLPPFHVNIRDADGTPVREGGLSAGTMYTPPVVIRNGDTYCLTRRAELSWRLVGTNRCFLNYWDGTGCLWTYEPLKFGNFYLSYLVVTSEKDVGVVSQSLGGMPVWSGSVQTKEAPFEILEIERK